MNLTIDTLRATLLAVLRDGGYDASRTLNSLREESSQETYRQLLGDVLIASDAKWRQQTLNLIDVVWKEEAETRTTIPVQDIVPSATIGRTKVSVWKGDITKLEGKNLAIVNAANDQGLGCFAPSHRCIDNVIHRAAGPRLRMECQRIMNDRGAPLATGTPPIVTSGYHLPSGHVIHATGPQVKDTSSGPTRKDREDLKRTYELVLDTVLKTDGIHSVAFPCISTGIFGFPQDDAAQIALSTVRHWLETHPESALDHFIFNVFANADWELYQKYFPVVLPNVEFLVGPSPRDRAIDLARQWINDADSVLICAGAGMSVKEGEMVYTNPVDFAKAYPWFPKWGYKTSYECMGLMRDSSVPATAKWALNAKHMDNMRWSFTPNEGYEKLLEIVGQKDYFVLTSNVDGCFERSGFDASKIYTPQGEWTWLQCTKACEHDSVYASRPYIDKILPRISDDGMIPEELIPKCPRCGSDMFGNVRGGSWFLHHKYEHQAERIQQWMQQKIDAHSKVVVIEIGAGFNTPTVTRFPVESFARELGDLARFIRINPTEAEVPEDLKALALEEGWQVLQDIKKSSGLQKDTSEVQEEHDVKKMLLQSDLLLPKSTCSRYERYFGHFDWRNFLGDLRTR